MIFFPFTVKKFENKVKKYIKEFRKSDFKQFSINQCIEKYIKLEKELLSKWHITVENDFLVMTYLGILKKKIKDDELQKYIGFDNKSARQVDKLSILVSEIYKHPELKEAVLNENVPEFEKKLLVNSQIAKFLEEYFEQYGGRFANELKLESSDIEEDKSKLLKLFKLYENYQNTNQKQDILRPKELIIKYVLKKFKKYASKREELRLLRSNTFSVVRKLFNRVGEDLVEKQFIVNKEDIYFLEISEIFDYQKHLNADNFKLLISERKTNYEKYSKVTPLAFFSLSEGDEIPVKEEFKSESKILKGRACTPGKIRGKVKVFKEYFIPDVIDFDILVTKNTDPGWTTLIGLSKGMIIEHGGILSHAAIVSRELGIPTVIGVENVVEILKDNQIVEIDGGTGKIEMI
jgi:pyruvate,water dikinase